MLASLTMATDDVNFGTLIFFLASSVFSLRPGQGFGTFFLFFFFFFQYVSFLLLYIIIFTLLFLSPNYFVNISNGEHH